MQYTLNNLIGFYTTYITLTYGISNYNEEEAVFYSIAIY